MTTVLFTATRGPAAVPLEVRPRLPELGAAQKAPA